MEGGSSDSGEDNKKPTEEELDEQLKNDSAGGNPLKALKNLLIMACCLLFVMFLKLVRQKLKQQTWVFLQKKRR